MMFKFIMIFYNPEWHAKICKGMLKYAICKCKQTTLCKYMWENVKSAILLALFMAMPVPFQQALQ